MQLVRRAAPRAASSASLAGQPHRPTPSTSLVNQPGRPCAGARCAMSPRLESPEVHCNELVAARSVPLVLVDRILEQIALDYQFGRQTVGHAHHFLKGSSLLPRQPPRPRLPSHASGPQEETQRRAVLIKPGRRAESPRTSASCSIVSVMAVLTSREIEEDGWRLLARGGGLRRPY